MQPNPYGQPYPGQPQYPPPGYPAQHNYPPPLPPGYPPPPLPPPMPPQPGPAAPQQIGTVDARGGGDALPALRNIEGRTIIMIPKSHTTQEPKYQGQPGEVVESITVQLHVLDGGDLIYGDSQDKMNPRPHTHRISTPCVFEGVRITDRKAILDELRPFVGTGTGPQGRIVKGVRAYLFAGLKPDDPVRGLLQQHVDACNQGRFVNPAPVKLDNPAQGWPQGSVPAAPVPGQWASQAQQYPPQPSPYAMQPSSPYGPPPGYGYPPPPPPGATVQYDQHAAPAQPAPSYVPPSAHRVTAPPPQGPAANAYGQPGPAPAGTLPPQLATAGWTQGAWDMLSEQDKATYLGQIAQAQ